MQKKLYRSRSDHIIAGVAGGLGEFFSVDATLVRLVMLLVVFAGGAGALLYIMAWVIIPVEPGDDEAKDSSIFSRSEALRRKMVSGAKQVEARLQRRKVEALESTDGEGCQGLDETDELHIPDDPDSTDQPEVEEEVVGGPPDTSAEEEEARRQRIGGLVLVGVGVLFVLRNLFPWINFSDMWPAFVIGLGLLLILRGLLE